MHAVDRYLLVAEAVGATLKGTPQFQWKPFDRDLALVGDLVKPRGLSIGQPWLAMHVSSRWTTKRWPLRSFAAVADQLARDGLGPTVVIGSQEERAEVEELKTLVKSPIIDLTGAIPLGCLPAFLSQAAAMVTNDSGPMHIAAAVGTPVIALFGPTSAIRTGPYGPSHTVLTHEVPCRPCFSRVCQHIPKMECLEDLLPQDVIQAIRHALSSRVALP